MGWHQVWILDLGRGWRQVQDQVEFQDGDQGRDRCEALEISKLDFMNYYHSIIISFINNLLIDYLDKNQISRL